MSWKVLIIFLFYTEVTPINSNPRNTNDNNAELPTNLFDDYVPKNPNSIVTTKVTDNIQETGQKNPENQFINFEKENPTPSTNTIKLNGQDYEVLDVIKVDDFPSNNQQIYPTQNNKPIEIQIQQFPGSNNRPINVNRDPFENAIVINQRPSNYNPGFNQNDQFIAHFTGDRGQVTGNIQIPQNYYRPNNFAGGPQYYGQPHNGNQNFNHLIRNGINTLASIGNAILG